MPYLLTKANIIHKVIKGAISFFLFEQIIIFCIFASVIKWIHNKKFVFKRKF